MTLSAAAQKRAVPARRSGGSDQVGRSGRSGSSGRVDGRLRTFLDNEWKYWLAQYPEFATSVGYPGQNGRWTDLSAAAIASRNRQVVQSLKLLRSVPRAELSAKEQLNYDLYENLLLTAIAGLKFHNDPFPMASVVPRNLYSPVNQIEGVVQDISNTIGVMPSERPSDYQNILARLNGVPALVDQTIELMRLGMSQHWTPPKITMRDLPKQVETQLQVSDPLASPLLSAFKKFPATITADQQHDFTRAAGEAYTDKVTPALRKFHDFLVTTYIPACRETISVQDLAGGAEFYKYLLRWHTTTKLTPQQIHDIGLQQVKEIHAEMDRVIAESKFQGSFQDFVKFINTDSQFRFTSADDLLLHYRGIAKKIDPELSAIIGRLPRLPYGVKPIPDATAPSQTAGYYEQGAPAIGRPGYFYVNTYNLDSRLKWDSEDLVLHEAVPGHHLQISLAQEMQGVPEFRKQLGFTAFVEGWALYSESLGSEIGLFANPYSKFGYLSAQMWRAVRLVVDTGIHSMGWSRDQAIRYFAENTGQPDQNVIVEVDRYIVWPGQALGYKIGQLKIRELRQSAEQRLGDRFDVRAFHDTVLDEGAVPLDILETRIAKWIQAETLKASGDLRRTRKK